MTPYDREKKSFQGSGSNRGQSPLELESLLSISLYVGMSICPYVCMSICPYVRTLIHSYIHASVRLYVHTCVRLYISTFVHLFVRTYVGRSVGLYLHRYTSARPSVCPSVCTYVIVRTYILCTSGPGSLAEGKPIGSEGQPARPEVQLAGTQGQ